MNNRFIVGLGLLIIGLALCITGLGLLLSPTEYQAVVKIKIEPDVASDVDYPAGDDVPYDPYFIQTEFKIMVSDIVLSNVVQSLNLDEKWDKQYGNGERLSTSAVVKRLRSRITIDAIPNTRLVGIRVTGEDPEEVEPIANAVVEAYKNYRVAQYEVQMADGLKMLEEDYQAEEFKIQAMQTQVDALSGQFNATNSNPSLKLTNDASYVRFKEHLNDTGELHQLLKAKLQSLNAEGILPKWSLVTTVEPAVPPKTPIGPGRLPGAILLVCGIVLSILGVHVLRGHGAKFPKLRQTGHES